ncbi:MAG: S1C family serine protease [Hyphomicrobiaceae bacterium]
MRSRLRVLRAAAAGSALLAGPAPVMGQSDIVWEKDGWRVQMLVSAQTALGCQAIKGFSSSHDPRRAAAWGFISTVRGHWGLAMIGPVADRMAGKRITISVDDQVLHVAVPRRLPNGLTMIGQLPSDRMGVIAGGRSLTFAAPATSAQFSLAGAGAALAAAQKCAVAVREATLRRPGGLPPAGRASAGASPRVSAGTGFYVSRSGDVLTNAHVVQGCSTIAIKGHGDATFRAVRVRAADTRRDLALLAPESPPVKPPTVLTWRRDTRLGEHIAIFGFPYLGALASSGTFTRGDITALAGVGDNRAHFQLSAPVQPGNSGGPVVDERGQVVGVVVAKLNALAVARAGGDIPQNVNFAIKSAQAMSFMEANGLAVAAGPAAARLSGPDLAERLRDGAVLVMCSSPQNAKARRAEGDTLTGPG